MLIVQKNTVNSLYVTVRDRTTLVSPYYLMSLYNNDNRSTKVLRLTGNTSTNTQRIDIFQLTETTSVNEDLDNAWVNLMSGASYDYVIYETSLSAGTVTTGLTSVEKGILKVSGGTTIATTTYTQTPTIATFQ